MNSKFNLLIVIIAICMLTSYSCSNKKVEITVDIPVILQDNENVVAYINDYARTIGEFKSIINELSVIPNKDNLEAESKPTNMPNLGMVKLTMKLSSITGKIKTYKAQRPVINKTLSEEQIEALNAVCQQLDTHLGQISDNTIDQSEIAATQEMQENEMAKPDSLSKALDELRGGTLGDFGDSESTKSSNEISPKIAIPIMIAAFAFFTFFGIKRFIKGARETIQNISHSVGDFKNTAQDLLDDPKKVTGQDKELSAKEKEGLEQLINIFGKNK